VVWKGVPPAYVTDNFFGRLSTLDQFLQVSQSLNEEQRRDVALEEIIQPDGFVYTEGLKGRLVENENGSAHKKYDNSESLKAMTRPSILKKLDQILRLNIEAESQVVYILAEVRKTIEQNKQLGDYFALHFYCSFALHTVMDRAGAQRILQRFDAAHPILVKKQELPRKLDREIAETIHLRKFRAQLKNFIAAHGLPDRLFADPDAWVRFLHLYGGVIDECTLTLRDDFLPLKNIDRVVLGIEQTTAPVEGFADQLIFVLRWTCHGKDGVCSHYESFNGYDAAPAT
jgi:hypothetical protein